MGSTRLAGISGLICIGYIATPAWAAGFLVRENSAEAVATSYAGNGSRATGPDTVFANPAGMTQLQGVEMEGGAAVILPSSTFSGVARQGGVPIAGDAGGDSGRTALVPDLYGAARLNDDLAVGVAITTPFGNVNEYDSNWYGRYLGTRAAAVSLDINPAFAWRITDILSVGAGISAQYLKLDITSAIDQAAILGAAVPDAFYRFKAHDWSVGFNGGLLANFGDTRLGLTYRSAVDHNIQGTLDFSGATPLLGFINGPASARTRLPATTGVSITNGITSDLALSADAQFSQWSSFKDVTIQSANPPFVNVERYRDSWMVALGATYRIDERWSLKAGVAYDETPVTSLYRSVVLPDTDRYLLGLGTEVKLTDVLAMNAAYGHSFAFNRPNMDRSINNTDPFTHSVMLNGRFDISVDILALSFRYQG